MGCFLVYFCVIIKFESGYMPSRKYAGRQNGFGCFFSFVLIVIVSLVANELFLMNYQRH